MRRTTSAAATLLVTLLSAAGMAAAADKGEAAKAKPGRTRVVRTWLEPATVGGESVTRRVSYVFDYDAGTFRRVVEDAAGHTLESKAYAPGEVEVRPSEAEIQEAFDRVRSEPEFARILDQTNGQLVGGFVLNEKAGLPCGPGTRCIHVQINTRDGWGLVRWAVVDLTKGAFAYRSYRPEMSEGVAR
jgi:hypothetical protein